MKFSKKTLLILIVIISVVALGLYIVIQQTLRLSADEPQKSMAQNIAQRLQGGGSPNEASPGYIDMASDMAPFIIIYDQYGKVVSGNGYLNNSVPQVPIGVLSASKGSVHTVTWEPQNDVRVASASISSGDRYVLVGRSLRVVENQEQKALYIVGGAWLILIAVLAVIYRLANKPAKNKGGDNEKSATTS